jgi:hypothetical protein
MELQIQMSCWETWIPTTGPSCPALMTWNFTYRPVQSTSMCGQLCFASDFFYEDTCIYLTTWLRIDLYASIRTWKIYKHNIGPWSHLVTRFKEKKSLIANGFLWWDLWGRIIIYRHFAGGWCLQQLHNVMQCPLVANYPLEQPRFSDPVCLNITKDGSPWMRPRQGACNDNDYYLESPYM